MFTGIVEELGTVESLATRPGSQGNSARLRVRCSTVLEDATVGASILVNGVCVTAVDLQPGSFAADLSPETLRSATWAICAPGRASIWSAPYLPAAV